MRIRSSATAEIAHDVDVGAHSSGGARVFAARRRSSRQLSCHFRCSSTNDWNHTGGWSIRRLLGALGVWRVLVLDGVALAAEGSAEDMLVSLRDGAGSAAAARSLHDLLMPTVAAASPSTLSMAWYSGHLQKTVCENNNNSEQ